MIRYWKKSKAAVLASVLVVLMSTAAIGTGIVSARELGWRPSSPTASAEAKITDVTDEFDASKIRDNQFNDGVILNDRKPSDKFWVFVNFSAAPVAERYQAKRTSVSLASFAKGEEARDASSDLRRVQDNFLNKLSRAGIGYEHKYSYTLLSNAVAIRVQYGDIAAIRAMGGVESVQISEYYYQPESVTVNDANVWGTGIYKTDGVEYDGNGLLVAVLDTGLDASHDAFQTMPTAVDGTFMVDKETVKSRVFDGNYESGLLSADRTTTADQVYYNAKVPFAYDYADKDAVVYPSYSTHGTHVAGIIGGNLGPGKEDEPIKDSDGNLILGKDGQPLTFRGVAPEAQLAICKVFTDDEDKQALGGAETIDILAALEDCVKLDVDIINMSLGSSAGFSEGDDAHMINVYNSIKEAGISLVVAASNDYSSSYGGDTGTNLTSNPDSATVGAPSTYDAALSVASINGQSAPYIIANQATANEAYAFFAEASDGNGNPKKFVEEILSKTGKTEEGEVELEIVEIRNYGRSTGYPSTAPNKIDMTGKIAFVQRGGNVTFEEKVRIAKQKGALGVIIHNNVSGTIRMSLGSETALPTCSITMDTAAQILAGMNKRLGKIKIAKTQVGGPFMSDFSSWGPNPDLRLKPEISAHGGEITSAVPGGWDEYSGTSMAAPNMAGAMSLVLQYIRDHHSAEYPTKQSQIEFANRLVMSTTTIAKNEYGNPYSPRKQGAGLASIQNAVHTAAYLYVDGSDKTKIELGDDPKKTGVYTLDFKLANFGGAAKTYKLETQTLTETVASNGLSVAERAYMLDNLCDTEATVNGTRLDGDAVTVAAGQTVSLSVKVTLNAAARDYLDKSFKNGMFVEGFVRLIDSSVASENDKTAGIDLSIPWLGFYGNWYTAPMFDISQYDLDAAKKDDSIPDDQKPVAAIYPTMPLGLYNNSQYIIPLGSYLYKMPASMSREIYSDSDKAAISMYDETNHRTVYELYSIAAGLLRGAKTMDVEITDVVSGETLYSKEKINSRKAYTGGSSTARGSAIELELSPKKLGLANNKQYNFRMKGTLDTVIDGRTPPDDETNSFDFHFYVDNQAPEITGYRVRFDSYKENNVVKYRTYLDLEVYDNQYAQSVALCYRNMKKNELELLTGELIPVEGGRNTTTSVTIDITDYYDPDLEFFVQVDDYALNTKVYRLGPTSSSYPDSKPVTDYVKYPSRIQIAELENDTAESLGGGTITVDTYEAKKLTVETYPADAAVINFKWASSDEEIVKVQNGELFGVKQGSAVISAYASANTNGKLLKQFTVSVTDNRVTDKINLTGFKLDLIETADGSRVDPTNRSISVHPSENIRLRATPEPWYYPDELDLRWSSSQENVVTVNEFTGAARTKKEGTAIVRGQAYVNDQPTPYSVSVTLNVGPEFVVENGVLREYHGAGGKVTIPKSLNVYYIYREAFKGNTNITELEISAPCTEIQYNAFEGCTSLKRVVFPETVTFVAKNSFLNCPKLERVDLRSRAITFNDYAFKGCTSLKYINNIVLTDPTLDAKKVDILSLRDAQFKRVSPNMTTVGDFAFQGCTSLTELDITGLRVTGNGAFSDCTKLERVKLSKFTTISNNMFYNCGKLKELEFTDTARFDFTSFLPPFAGCSIETVKFAGDAEYYRDPASGVLYESAEMRTLVWAPQTLSRYTVPASVTTILANAFSGNANLVSVDFTKAVSLDYIGDYAFANTGLTSVNVPSSVARLGVGVFRECGRLTTANFAAASGILPEGTFELTGLKELTLGSGIRSIGDRAFYFTDFTTIDLSGSNVTEMGDYVFANCYLLTNVVMPKVTKLGEGTFTMDFNVYYLLGSLPDVLASVTFPEGATALGSATFAMSTASLFYAIPRNALTQVSIPASMRNAITEVEPFVFANCAGLTSVDLGAVTNVGAYAFYNCTKLGSGIDTTGMTDAGSYAFYNCQTLPFSVDAIARMGSYAFAKTGRLTSANLSHAASVAPFAFYMSSVTSVDLTGVKTIGEHAFESSKLSGVVTLPESLENTYSAIGKAAFAGVPATAFALNGEHGSYFVRDGVLYSVLPNGFYQLEAYPAASYAAAYIVIDGTVRIGDEAFRATVNLENVILPYSLTAIGDKAFYLASVEDYTFGSLRAPVLEAYLVDGTQGDSAEYFAFVTKGEELYNANFTDYAIYLQYAKLLGKPADFKLTLRYPANGTGYDNRLWTRFFTTSATTEIIPDDATRDAIAAIEEIPSKADVLALLNAQDRPAAVQTLKAYRVAIKAARDAYRKIAGDSQRAFVTKYKELTSAEEAVRTVRVAFGENVEVADVRVKQFPTKLTYTVGDVFDPTGLLLTVIYDDGSEAETAEGYEFGNVPLTLGQQLVSFTYAGIARELAVTVNAKTDPKPTEPSTGGGCGCGGTLIAGNVIAGVIVIGVVTLLLLRKRKKQD